MLSAIVCMDNFGGIGKDGDLLYKIPEDTQRFRELTMGHWVIMGRKTWNSIGNKPLPGRTNIIISNTLNFSMPETNKYNSEFETSVNIWKDITEEKIKFYAEQLEEYFVIGGQSIYEMFLPYCDKVYATIVNNLLNADTYFPVKDLIENFDCISDIRSHNDEITYHFKEYVNINKIGHSNKLSKTTASRAYSDPIPGHSAVQNPSHYTSGKYEVINYIEDKGLSYCLGNVAKYICRAGKKYPGDSQKELQDLKKAKWYLERRLTESNTVDEEDPLFKIDIDDFIKDQKLNYIRGEIIRNISTWENDDIGIKLNISLALLDAEIHRMEESI
jgi:dihydrofolate reductase